MMITAYICATSASVSSSVCGMELMVTWASVLPTLELSGGQRHDAISWRLRLLSKRVEGVHVSHRCACMFYWIVFDHRKY